MNAAEDAFHRAIAAERLQNARAVNALRLGALTVLLVLLALFRRTIPGWIGPPLAPLALWWTAAVIVLWASRRSDRLTRLGSLSIALVDMPMAFLVLAMTIERLHAAGRHGDAARLALHAGVYDVGLIFVASLALEQRRIYLAAAIAVALETGLMFLGRKEDPSIMVMSAAAMGMMGVAVAYASSRALALVRAVVEEHRRRGGSAAISRRRLPRVSSSAAISPPWARGTRYHPVQRPQGLYSAQRAARGRAGRAARRG